MKNSSMADGFWAVNYFDLEDEEYRRCHYFRSEDETGPVCETAQGELWLRVFLPGNLWKCSACQRAIGEVK